jgi:hypothetical protein
MKTRKIFTLLLVPVMIVALTINCSDEEAITTGIKDVSSRVTGYTSERTGAGAPLTVTGSGLDRVQRVVFGTTVIPKKSFTEVSESSMTFPVPASATLGETPVFLVFPGNERAFAPAIEVIPRPVISTVKPLSAETGETITVLGSDLSHVKGVTIGGVAAAITSQSNTVLKFTMPAGAATSIVTLTGDAGTVNSAAATQTVVACSQNAGNSLCKQTLIVNGSLEEGAGENFNNWSKFNGAARLLPTVSESETFRGGRALRAVVDPVANGGPDQWRLQFASDLVNDLEVGASYTLSARIKSAATGTTMRFSTQPSALYQGNTTVGTDWTLISWTFTANVTSARMVLDLNGPVNTVYFVDDIRLVKN